MRKKVLFPALLLGLTAPLCFSQQFSGVSAEFIGDYSKSAEKSDYIKAGSALNEQICDEGFVLLKNKDNFLPMAGQGQKVSLVGKSSGNLVRGGGGSGSGSVKDEENWQLVRDSGGNETIKGSLEEAGFQVNMDIQAFYGKWSSGGWGGLSYSNDSRSGSGRTNGNDGWKGNSEVTIGETPLSSYSAELLATLDEYNDAAIQVISREGSEGCDVKTCNAHDSKKTNSSAEKVSDRHALQLSENEEALFEELKKHTDNIIIVVNSGNIFQCDKFENDDKVKAILWIGNPGAVGAKSVGKILTGQVNPSGRTVDTWARDFTKDPTFQNFSDNSQTNEVVSTNGKTYYAPQDTLFAADGAPMLSYGTDKNYKEHSAPRWDTARGGEEFKVVSGGLNGVKPASYLAYEEGIYVDYRYYETRYADMAKGNKGEADTWYGGEEGVIYPFGYGLSYTSFKQEIVSSNVKGKTLKDGIYDIEVKVKVKNTGNVAGKDVVQLYWKAPYTKGGIEKADRVLCAFAKTKLLNKGESETLTLKINTQDFANYDFADKNGNGFKGYELDGGDYYITLNQNAHEELGSVKFSVAKEGIKYDKDRYTGHEVKNRFTDRGFYDCLPGENDFDFEQYSREDMANVPTHPTYEDRTVKAGSRYEEYLTHEFRMEDLENENKGLYIPEEVNKTKADIEALGWTQPATAPSQADSIQFQDLVGLDINDPLWERAMNQMTYNEMIGFSYGGGQHNQAISRMGKPATGDSDGPSQFQIIWWAGAPIVAATYNVDLAKRQGEMVGMEAHINGTYGWAGPAVNLHRSPFGGRNFEYYSADPFLMGKIAGRVVAGATDLGLYCFFKHFAVNDQEKNREGVSAFLTEQALREIYLKPFQIVVQEGKSMAIMSSYNRLGLMETAASYPLLTEVLRDEWGFKGHIISDMTHSGNGSVNNYCYENINDRILAGCNQQLDSNGFRDDIECKWDSSAFDGKGAPVFTKKDGTKVESYTWWYMLRKNVKETMWTCANSGVMSKVCVKEAHLTFKDVVNNRYVGAVGANINIKVELPNELKAGGQYNEKTINSVEMVIDPVTPLPAGLSFDGNTISGTPERSSNWFIRVLVKLSLDGDDEPTTLGSSLELFVPEIQSADLPNKKAGCFGSLEATMVSVMAFAIAGVALLLVTKKRRENA